MKKFSLDFVKSLGKQVYYFGLGPFKFLQKKGNVVQVYILLHEDIHKLPDSTIRINSFNDFNKSSHFLLNHLCMSLTWLNALRGTFNSAFKSLYEAAVDVYCVGQQNSHYLVR